MSAVAEEVTDFSHLFVEARNRAITDPVWFCENILQLKALPGEKTLKQDPNDSWELDQWQRNLLEAVGDIVRKEVGLPTVINHDGKNQITVCAMHGPGKTFGLAAVMHWFGFCFLGKMPCTAPKLAQVKTRLWPEFRKIRNRALPGYKNLMDVTGGSIKWLDSDGKYEEGSHAFMETASTPENLAGLHDKFMCIFVDEASGVDESLWPVIEGAISTGKIVILIIISNPTRTTGTFADSHLKPKVSQDWFQLKIRLEDTKRVSRDWVRKMENKYGKGSPVVKVRCYGEFSSSDENQLIDLEWIEAARNRSGEGDGSLPRWRLSADVADGGLNFSVITLARHYESFALLYRQRQFSYPSGRAVTMLCNELERWWEQFGLSDQQGDDIVIDGLGVGAGAVSEMVEREYPVIRYIGGASSDNIKLYRNRRTQSYLVLRDRFRLGTIAIHDDFVEEDDWDDLLGQLCSIRRKITGTERIEDLMSKKEMTEAGIVSPDRADSIAIQFTTQTPMLVKIRPEDIVLIQSMETASNEGSLT